MTDDSLSDEVYIALLGGFAVTVGRTVVTQDDWPTRRSGELVALLALAEGHRLVRDQVIEALWPHLSPAAGAANLRKAAHFVRQVIGSEDAMRLAGGRVALFPGSAVGTDVAAFERRARVSLRSGDRAAAAAVAADYPGDLLPELPYAEWTQQPRDRLRACHVDLLRLGGLWERLASVEPADEQAHRELMRAALDSGAPHTAIRWYGRLRTNLERQLGLAPSAESRALYEECVASLPPTPEVVGRQQELARMAAALRSAAAEGPAALVVRGAAGIGKSRLCRELAATAREAGWRVATVAAGPSRGAYAALSTLVHQLLGDDRAPLDRLPGAARSVLAALTALAGPAQPATGGSPDTWWSAPCIGCSRPTATSVACC